LQLFPDKLYHDECNAICDYLTREHEGIFATHRGTTSLDEYETMKQERSLHFVMALSISAIQEPKTGKKWTEALDAMFQFISRQNMLEMFQHAEFVRERTKSWNSPLFGDYQKEYGYIKNVYKTNLIEHEDGITDERLFGLQTYIRENTTGNVTDYSHLQ